jgi:hypothetical protein
MTQYERAAQIWSMLAWAAINRQELTYDIVGRLIGVPRRGLGRLLEPIQSYCLVRQLPPLTLLVVSEVNGQPSSGFTATQQIPEERQRVYGFDWLDHPAPTPELLEQAVRQQPSNGVTATAMEDALSQPLPP